MRRVKSSMGRYAWLLLIAVLAVAITAGVTSAQVPGDAPDSAATEPPAAVADAPAPAPTPAASEIAPVPPAPEAEPPSEPTAPPVTDAPAAPEVPVDPAPVATGGDTPAAPVEADPTISGPAPERVLPAPSSSEPAPGLVLHRTEPVAESTPPEPDHGAADPADGNEPGGFQTRQKRLRLAAAANNDFEHNPCRSAPRSTACAQFLYPRLCQDARSDTCQAVVTTNPCVTDDPAGDLCRAFLESACRTDPQSSRCFAIRVIGLINDDPPPRYVGRWEGQKNPCREDYKSDDCQDWLGDAGIAWCRYADLDEQSCLNLLVLFQLPRETNSELGPGQNDCLAIRVRFPDLQPPAGSVCEYYLATEFDSCSRRIPAIICVVPFGGSTERLGVEGAGGPGGGPGDGGNGGNEANPLLGGGGSNTGDRDAVVPEPPGSRPLTASADQAPGRGKRTAESLPHTGRDLEQSLLVALSLLLIGDLLRRRASTRPRPER